MNGDLMMSPKSMLLCAATVSLFTAAASAQTTPAVATNAMPSAPISVYAAGSLREAMNALADAYAAERRSSTNVSAAAANDAPTFKFLFGPSGKLRERIAAGEATDAFASASPSHTDRLLKEGKLRSSNVFASNAMCVIARPGVKVTTETVIDTLLSPDVILGVSTPGADPAGDYTWEMFKKIDAERPGAFAQLDKKAQKLTGAEVNQADTVAPYAKLLTNKRADVFVTYCTNAATAQKINAGITIAKVPASIDVPSAYAIGLTTAATESAREFVRYVLSQRAQKVMAQFGFSAPTAKCEGLASPLAEAYSAWTAAPTAVTASARAKGEVAPEIGLAKRLQLTLKAQETLGFGRPAKGKAPMFGGATAFVAQASGRIEVFVDRRAWVDVVRVKDQVVMGPQRSDRWLGCAGVGKNMGFDVVAGERYELRLSEIDAPEATALVMPLAAAPAAASTTLPPTK